MRTTLSVLILLVSFLICRNSATLANEPLQGGVKMDEHLHAHLTALNICLSPGNTFDRDVATALLKSEIPQNVWFKIPTALAGNWKTHDTTTLDVRDEVTMRTSKIGRPHLNKSATTWGYFPSVDKEFWWHFADSNYWGKVETEYYDCWFFITNVEPIRSTYKNVRYKFLSVTFKVDKISKRILNVCQRESVQSQTIINDDLTQLNEVAREYGFDGNPLRTARMTTVATRSSIPAVRADTTHSGRNSTELILAYFQDRAMSEEYQNIIRITQGGEHLPASDKSLITGSTFDKDLVMPQLGKNALEKRRSEQSLQQ